MYLFYMMDNTLDLNIYNYSIKDLETFFGLKQKSKYTADDVESKEYTIRETLLKSGHVDKRFKRDLIEFLDKAKKLLMIKFDEKKAVPTTLPKNVRLDEVNYPYSTDIPYSRQGDIISRNEKQFIYAKPDDFFQGNMNPLTTRVVHKCLSIDSKFRENYYYTKSSDFLLQLPYKINKVVSMQLSSIELPVAFYGISKNYGNNHFFITVNYLDDNGIRVEKRKQIIISDGNYVAQDLLDKINCILHEDKDIFSKIHVFLDISEKGSGTGKMTIEPIDMHCCENPVRTILLDFSRNIDGVEDTQLDITRTLGWNLGFNKALYCGFKTYTGDTLVEPASIRYIYLAIDDFNNSVNNQFVSAFDKMLDPHILARISIKGSYFSLVMENDFNIVTEPRQYFGPVDIQRLKIRLLDEHGRILDMNESNFSFCLNFKVMYDL